jgi:ATP-binding cassette, subfamily B (MDR/TAP), member 1
MAGLLSVVGSLGVACVNIAGSTILALAVAWKLALVTLFGSMPVIVLAGFLRVRSASRKSKSLSESLIQSAEYAAEALGMLRTVSSVTIESAVCAEYERQMRSAQPVFYRGIFVAMPLFAFAKGGALLGMALSFWYGGKLLTQGEISSTQLWIVFMAVVASAEAAGEFFGSSNSKFTLTHAKQH